MFIRQARMLVTLDQITPQPQERLEGTLKWERAPHSFECEALIGRELALGREAQWEGGPA